MKFEINLIFLIKSFFLYNQKVKAKISWERKEFLRWNKKYFSSFLKGFLWHKFSFLVLKPTHYPVTCWETIGPSYFI